MLLSLFSAKFCAYNTQSNMMETVKTALAHVTRVSCVHASMPNSNKCSKTRFNLSRFPHRSSLASLSAFETVECLSSQRLFASLSSLSILLSSFRLSSDYFLSPVARPVYYLAFSSSQWSVASRRARASAARDLCLLSAKSLAVSFDPSLAYGGG